MRLEQVAAEAEVSYPYLRTILAGTARNPSIHVLGRIASVYGHTLAELFGGDVPAGAR
jgi:transcriptional regulator with XRE-family HTH domain